MVEGFGSPSSPAASLGFIVDTGILKRCHWKAVEMLGRMEWSVWWRRRRNGGSGLIKSGGKESQEGVNLPAVFHHVMGLGRWRLQGKSRGAIRGKEITVRALRCWNRFSTEVVASLL